MRPVIKGTAPYLFINSYQEARGYLIERIGEYCSYCERKIPVNLAVEHVKPKTLYGHLEHEWDNLILACTNCNSTKGHTDVNLSEYYWPHMDNTLLPFIYKSSGLIEVNNNLSKNKKIMAQNLINLVGLNKKPNQNDTTVSNRLWNNRLEAWNIANEMKLIFESTNNLDTKERLRKAISKLAYSSGFFFNLDKYF